MYWLYSIATPLRLEWLCITHASDVMETMIIRWSVDLMFFFLTTTGLTRAHEGARARLGTSRRFVFVLPNRLLVSVAGLFLHLYCIDCVRCRRREAY